MAGIHQLPQRVFMERQMLLQALGRLPYRISTPEAAVNSAQYPMSAAVNNVGKRSAEQGDCWNRGHCDLRRRGWRSLLERALAKSLKRREGGSLADTWGKNPPVWMV